MDTSKYLGQYDAFDFSKECSQELLGELATHYADHATIRTVVAQAGMEAGNIVLAGSPRNVWFEVLTSAAKQRKLARLLKVTSLDGDEKEPTWSMVDNQPDQWVLTHGDATLKVKQVPHGEKGSRWQFTELSVGAVTFGGGLSSRKDVIAEKFVEAVRLLKGVGDEG